MLVLLENRSVSIICGVRSVCTIHVTLSKFPVGDSRILSFSGFSRQLENSFFIICMKELCLGRIGTSLQQHKSRTKLDESLK